MRAKVQTRFPFLGKMRNPGDVLSDEEMAKVSPTVRDALVRERHIILDASDNQAARVADLEERVATLEDLINQLLNDKQPKRASGTTSGGGRG